MRCVRARDTPSRKLRGRSPLIGRPREASEMATVEEAKVEKKPRGLLAEVLRGP
jgi:hypothetical protein